MKDVHKVYKALCAIVLAVAIVFTPFVCKPLIYKQKQDQL